MNQSRCLNCIVYNNYIWYLTLLNIKIDFGRLVKISTCACKYLIRKKNSSVQTGVKQNTPHNGPYHNDMMQIHFGTLVLFLFSYRFGEQISLFIHESHAHRSKIVHVVNTRQKHYVSHFKNVIAMHFGEISVLIM